MKKYLSLLAVILAIGFSAFTSKADQKQLTNYFWYDLVGGSLGYGTLPNNGCIATGTDCARGFVVEPNSPTQDMPDQTKAYN